MTTALAADVRKEIQSRLTREPLSGLIGLLKALDPATPVAGDDMRFTIVDDAPRFTLLADELVRDNTTGLTWTRFTVGGKTRHNWEAAQKVCAELRAGRYSDWRLPTIKELLSLVDYERASPAIDTDVFTCESNWYWTSTPAASDPADYAWYVYFDYGNSLWSRQDGEFFVRAVRSGQ